MGEQQEDDDDHDSRDKNAIRDSRSYQIVRDKNHCVEKDKLQNLNRIYSRQIHFVLSINSFTTALIVVFASRQD